MDERFETDLRAGYPDDAPGVVLGSPMLDGEVLAGVRVRLPLSTVNRHGLVAGATGTGKTKTLQVIAGQLSDVVVTSGGTIGYKVCEYRTTLCSNTASVTF